MCDWPLLKCDVKNAFLYGDLPEEVYITLLLCLLVFFQKDLETKTKECLLWA